MVNGAALVGSPLTTAIWAPLGNTAGAGPQVNVLDSWCEAGAYWAWRAAAQSRRPAVSGSARIGSSEKMLVDRGRGARYGLLAHATSIRFVPPSHRAPDVRVSAPELRLLLPRRPGLRSRGATLGSADSPRDHGGLPPLQRDPPGAAADLTLDAVAPAQVAGG